MSDNIEQEIIELASSCQIDYLSTLFNNFESVVDKKIKRVVLDASKVTKITSPIFQLIISLEKALAMDGGGVILKDPSEEFVQCITKLGLANLITQWSSKNV
jgi:anti-anti-sigma regulatory factor